MRHHLKFEVFAHTAREMQAHAETVAAEFFGPDVQIQTGNIHIVTTRADNSTYAWVGQVSVDVRERPAKSQEGPKYTSASTDFSILGSSLAEIVRRVEGRLGELYGSEPYHYNLAIKPFEYRWEATVSAWLGSNDMGDF